MQELETVSSPTELAMVMADALRSINYLAQRPRYVLDNEWDLANAIDLLEALRERGIVIHPDRGECYASPIKARNREIYG